MATDSPRLRTAKAYIGFFSTLDTAILTRILSDDANFTHIMAPASLAIPPLNKAEFIAHTTRLRNIMQGFPVFAREYHESDTANSVIVWATSRTEFRPEAMGEGAGMDKWTYEGEYVFMLTMDASGERIVRVVEVLDSLKTDRHLMPLINTAKERIAALEGGR